MMHYFGQLYLLLQTQNKKIEEMNTRIRHLQKEINEWKEKSTPQVIKNEYKFDLLKVEKLEGTLNIGLNPNGGDASIEDFAVNQSMDIPANDKDHPELFPGIQQEIYHYLNHDASTVLKELEHQYAYPLDEPYRNFILDDIRKQIDKRIRHYLSRIQAEQISPEQLPQIKKTVTQQVQQDINKTLEAFIKNLPRKEKDS